MPEHTPEGGAGTAPAEEQTDTIEDRTFAQEDVDRIVTERLRRERQRAEKTVRDEYEQRIAELEAAAEDVQQERADAATLSTQLRAAEKRAVISERLLARGTTLPPAYLPGIDGEDGAAVDAAIDAAEERWASDMRKYGRPPADIGSPTQPAAAPTKPQHPVDADLAERMRRGDAGAFTEYRAMRG